MPKLSSRMSNNPQLGKVARLTVVFLLLLLVAVPTFAQRTTASIRGVVQDAEGAIIPGVVVELEGVETGYARTTSTNASGAYNFSGIPVGVYNIQVQLDGFQTAVIEGVEEGERVVTDGRAALHDGQRVRVLQTAGGAR